MRQPSKYERAYLARRVRGGTAVAPLALASAEPAADTDAPRRRERAEKPVDTASAAATVAPAPPPADALTDEDLERLTAPTSPGV